MKTKGIIDGRANKNGCTESKCNETIWLSHESIQTVLMLNIMPEGYFNKKLGLKSRGAEGIYDREICILMVGNPCMVLKNREAETWSLKTRDKGHCF